MSTMAQYQTGFGSDIPPLFHWPLYFCTGLTTVCYVLSVITGNVSQVDRIWTFAPPIYTAYFSLLPLWPKQPASWFHPYTPEDSLPSRLVHSYSPRALMMLGLQTVWMLRLSYNTYRRGLFSFSDEDYRWPVLRARVPKWLFQVINISFIAIIQNIILFLLAVPTSIAVAQPHLPLTTSDMILGGLSLLTLLVEFTADNQQNSFQNYKHSGGVHDQNAWPGARLHWTPQDAKRGFVARGLWAWTRHPNFLCEQTFWILQNLIPLLAPSPPSLSTPLGSTTSFWTLTPCLTLCGLFYASTLFSESITGSKYPAYADYKKRVAMFVPFLTPVWGFLLQLQGKKQVVDESIWGAKVKGAPKAVKAQ